ncbi:hypothetical protein FOVSG1_001997 [Fusarium oxysporum f. sp. vasinfectum]
MLLQILRFNLLPSLTISGQAFTDPRKQVALAGATHQYFGYSVQTLVAPLPKERHEITWIIRWPVGLELSRNLTLNGLSRNCPRRIHQVYL